MLLTTNLWTTCTMHTNIVYHLRETIEAWNFNVFCTIHDSASSMNLAMELCEVFFHHLGHTLQLTIKKGLMGE